MVTYESGRVVVPGCFGVTEGFQQRVSLDDLFIQILFIGCGWFCTVLRCLVINQSSQKISFFDCFFSFFVPSFSSFDFFLSFSCFLFYFPRYIAVSRDYYWHEKLLRYNMLLVLMLFGLGYSCSCWCCCCYSEWDVQWNSVWFYERGWGGRGRVW